MNLHHALASVSLMSIGLLMCGCSEKASTGSLTQSKLSQKFAAGQPAAAEVVKPTTVSLAIELSKLCNLVRTELGDSVVAAFSTTEIDKAALALSSRLFMVTDASLVLPALNKAIFHDAGIVFDADRNRLSSLFPQTVLSSKRGSCLGISLVELLIAEKLDLPLHGIIVPGHFFVRYDNGTVRQNIDPMKSGESLTDAWYRKRFGVKWGSFYTMSNLDKREVVAVVAFNVGNALRERGKGKTAIACYEQVVQTFPRWGEAWGNLGVTYAAMGSGDKALAMFEKARQVEPRLAGLSRNLGSLFVRQQQYDRAAAEYERGLEDDPNNPDLLYGLAYATFCVKDYGRAAQFAQRALAVRSNFGDAQALLEKASAKRNN